MTWIGWVVLACVVLWLIDRAGRWAERRGWVYWTRRGTAGAAAGPLFEVFQPTYHHVVQERERQRLEIRRAAADAPVVPGSPPDGDDRPAS